METLSTITQAQVPEPEPLAGLQSLVAKLAGALALRTTTDILLEESTRLTRSRGAKIALVQPDLSLASADAVPLSDAVRDACALAVASRSPRRDGSVLALPLVVRNRPLGALVLDEPRETRQPYLDAIATYAALALDRAILHESETQHRDALEASESRFRSLVQELDAVFWECDPVSFQFSFVSDRAEKLLGYPTSSWLQPGFWASIIHPEDRHWAVDFCVECTKDGRDHAFEYRMLASDGSVHWFRDVVYVLRNDDGAPSKLRGVMLDITHERQAVSRGRVAKRLRQSG